MWTSLWLSSMLLIKYFDQSFYEQLSFLYIWYNFNNETNMTHIIIQMYCTQKKKNSCFFMVLINIRVTFKTKHWNQAQIYENYAGQIVAFKGPSDGTALTTSIISFVFKSHWGK